MKKKQNKNKKQPEECRCLEKMLITVDLMMYEILLLETIIFLKVFFCDVTVNKMKDIKTKC